MIFIALADDIRDIKGPVYFLTNYLPYIIIASIAILTAFFFLFRFLFKKMRENREDKAREIKPPHIIAYEALTALKARNLPAQGKVKEYYYELSCIVRRYIENRWSVRAPEMTTEEFLSMLKDSDNFSAPHKNLLKEFLNLCDIVKFAKYGPVPNEIDSSFDAATKFIDETKQISEERIC